MKTFVMPYANIQANAVHCYRQPALELDQKKKRKKKAEKK